MMASDRPMRAALYARVSTTDQTTENQAASSFICSPRSPSSSARASWSESRLDLPARRLRASDWDGFD
jgi:hypothetical protein